MKKLAFLTAAAAMMLFSAGPALADKGGCPNDSSANGATHANDNSAHGAGKQVARGCVPTPPVCDPVIDPTCNGGN